MTDNWNEDLPCEGMKVKRKCHVAVFAFAEETRSTTKVLSILYFVSDPESESELESGLIMSPESESEQPHHDSAPLVSTPSVSGKSRGLSGRGLNGLRGSPWQDSAKKIQFDCVMNA